MRLRSKTTVSRQIKAHHPINCVKLAPMKTLLSFLPFKPLGFVYMLFFTGLATGVYADENADRQKLEQVKRSIAALKAELEATKSNRDQMLKTLEASESAIGSLSKKADALKAELQEQQKGLDELRDERTQLLRKKASQQAHVGQHINAAYRLGQQSSLRLLLNQQDPATVARNLKYYDYMINARANQIQDFNNTIERINLLEPEIAFKTTKLAQHHRQLETQQAHLVSAQKKRQSTLNRLNASIHSSDSELKHMLADRSRLEEILSQVTAWLDDIKVPATGQFSSLKGTLPWPTDGQVVKHFGASRVTNKIAWQGMLIRSHEGAPVAAISHGRIIFSDYLRGHGLLIIVDHGDGYMSLYAHNHALFKELGEWVDAGDVIASVGNSGGQQQSALYFELRYRGQPTNPKKWFRPA